MGVIKTEVFDIDVSSNGQTHTLTNSVTLANAFVRNNNGRNASAGPTGSTGNAGSNSISTAAYLTGTSTVTFANSGVSQKYIGELWRYTGSSGGSDEFIVRGRYQVTVASGSSSNSVAVSGIVDRNKCIPFITGKISTSSSVTEHNRFMANAYIDASDNLVVDRNNAGATALDVYVTVVEFTGVNWVVGHAKSGFSTATPTIYDDSRGNTGNTLTLDWNNTMIADVQVNGDTGSNYAIEDVQVTAEPGTSSTVSIAIDSTSASNGSVIVHLLSNVGMSVARATTSQTIPNNGTYNTETFPTGSTLSSLDEGSVEWTVFSDGTGTAHARGSLSAKLSSTTQIQSWVHRSGNAGTYAYGVADLGGVDNTIRAVIDNVDTDNVITNTQQNVVVTGSGFEASQGTGTIKLTQNSDGTGISVTQSVDSWSDTTIQFDTSAGGLVDSNCYVYIETDGGSIGVQAITVGVPPITYTETVGDLSPDHYWTWNNTYVDIGLQGPNNAAVSGGSPTFTTNPLTRDKTHAWTITAQGQGATPPNSNFINGQTETTRTMGGWIRFTEIQDSFTCFYEEGGSVNNITFLMGIGGILIAQLADTGDDNVHAYSDFKLEPNRTYHIVFRFDYNGTDRFELLVDGVVQTVTFGNPLTATDLDSHSGDIAFGGTYDTLEVFGTDIQFPGVTTCYYQDWASWTVFLSDTQVREELFEKGVIGKYTISSGTEAAMQTALDAYADTVQGNDDCTFIIETSTDGDFELDFDNIVFNDSTSIQVQYQGAGTLTANNLNGSNLEASKISVPNGGTVTIVTPSTLTVNNLKNPTEVRVYTAGTQTEVAGQENVTSGTFSTSVSVSSVDIVLISLGYQILKLEGVDTSSDTSFPVNQLIDRQYENV